ncbi:MAG: hypothetical protein M9900_01135 [Flavobacteriales bacterium]|nr:hypothetical protein [Flavobacteriales bacterium]HRN37926.1 hypothetical protein [Flavobacteriales bacterium]HRO40374.1 hypothetical protein [Flavobacteriales bacterium]HRP82427.1 hypothetical protein [Flavobacteriales bacterium]
MQAADWIALAQLAVIAVLGTWVAVRLERIRKLYARNLKRYDLLHTARFKALEAADDCMAEWQQAQFLAWKSLQPPTSGPDEAKREVIDGLRRVAHALALAKIKCEKYFDEAFNKEFAQLVGKVQDAEMRMRDVYELNGYVNAEQLRPDRMTRMNDACTVTRDAVPAFRKRMGEIIQRDLEE